MGLFSDFLQKGNAFQPGGTGSITSSLVENTNNLKKSFNDLAKTGNDIVSDREDAATTDMIAQINSIKDPETLAAANEQIASGAFDNNVDRARLINATKSREAGIRQDLIAKDTYDVTLKGINNRPKTQLYEALIEANDTNVNTESIKKQIENDNTLTFDAKTNLYATLKRQTQDNIGIMNSKADRQNTLERRSLTEIEEDRVRAEGQGNRNLDDLVRTQVENRGAKIEKIKEAQNVFKEEVGIADFTFDGQGRPLFSSDKEFTRLETLLKEENESENRQQSNVDAIEKMILDLKSSTPTDQEKKSIMAEYEALEGSLPKILSVDELTKELDTAVANAKTYIPTVAARNESVKTITARYNEVFNLSDEQNRVLGLEVSQNVKNYEDAKEIRQVQLQEELADYKIDSEYNVPPGMDEMDITTVYDKLRTDLTKNATEGVGSGSRTDLGSDAISDTMFGKKVKQNEVEDQIDAVEFVVAKGYNKMVNGEIVKAEFSGRVVDKALKEFGINNLLTHGWFFKINDITMAEDGTGEFARVLKRTAERFDKSENNRTEQNRIKIEYLNRDNIADNNLNKINAESLDNARSKGNKFRRR
jgi:hypothetical protein